jgi:hypothetical protein
MFISGSHHPSNFNKSGHHCRCVDIFTPEEQKILLKYRKENFAEKTLISSERRMIGKCPLTPEEVSNHPPPALLLSHHCDAVIVSFYLQFLAWSMLEMNVPLQAFQVFCTYCCVW